MLTNEESEKLLQLKTFGFIPGNFSGFCTECDKLVHDIDKKATHCIECAQSLLDVSKQNNKEQK